MGTCQYTKMNFSVYELTHMIGRVEVLNEIAYIKLSDQNIIFPNKRTDKTKVYPLPSDDEISGIIASAKCEAIKNATALGMSTHNDIDEYTFSCNENIFNQIESDEECLIEDIDDDEMMQALVEDESLDVQSCDENSPYVIVRDENGIKRKIRKSTYIWMLSEPSERISNDRLRRVQVKNN